MMKMSTTIRKTKLVNVICTLLPFVILISMMGMSVEAASSLQRPMDVDGGFWVNAYRDYMDNWSSYRGYAVLADFDLDGLPELLALDENWSHVGANGCVVKYTGSQYKVYNFETFFIWDDELCLTMQNDGYAWYMSRSITYAGDTTAWVSKLNINENLVLSETEWFSHLFSINNPDDEYRIGSKSVSRSEYDQQEAKWNSMTKLFTVDPISFPYPSSWNNAINQYSVIIRHRNIPSVPSQPGSKYNSIGGLGAYIGTRYVVNCDEWISLRKEPNTSSERLIKIPFGGKVDDCYEAANGFYYCEYIGVKGFVLKKYLSNTPPSLVKPNPKPNDSRYDLNQYEYLPVVEKGRGALVFQKTPRGSFMKNHKFHDGDYVYVNVNWRQNGYAIAYEDGEYGYVDASYIDW